MRKFVIAALVCGSFLFGNTVLADDSTSWIEQLQKSIYLNITGIIGTGEPTTGIIGTGQSTNGIVGTGQPTKGIVGTGEPTKGIVGTGKE